MGWGTVQLRPASRRWLYNLAHAPLNLSVALRSVWVWDWVCCLVCCLLLFVDSCLSCTLHICCCGTYTRCIITGWGMCPVSQFYRYNVSLMYTQNSYHMTGISRLPFSPTCFCEFSKVFVNASIYACLNCVPDIETCFQFKYNVYVMLR